MFALIIILEGLCNLEEQKKKFFNNNEYKFSLTKRKKFRKKT